MKIGSVPYGVFYLQLNQPVLRQEIRCLNFVNSGPRPQKSVGVVSLCWSFKSMYSFAPDVYKNNSETENFMFLHVGNTNMPCYYILEYIFSVEN